MNHHDEKCLICGVLRSKCLPGGRFYDECPLALGLGHAWRPLLLPRDAESEELRS